MLDSSGLVNKQVVWLLLYGFCYLASFVWLLLFGCCYLAAAIWLLLSCCCYLAAAVWLLPSGSCYLAADIWLLLSGFCPLAPAIRQLLSACCYEMIESWHQAKSDAQSENYLDGISISLGWLVYLGGVGSMGQRWICGVPSRIEAYTFYYIYHFSSLIWWAFKRLKISMAK